MIIQFNMRCKLRLALVTAVTTVGALLAAQVSAKDGSTNDRIPPNGSEIAHGNQAPNSRNDVPSARLHNVDQSSQFHDVRDGVRKTEYRDDIALARLIDKRGIDPGFAHSQASHERTGDAHTAFDESRNATDVYFLRANNEYSDGHSTRSTSRDIVVGRARRGDRSMILQDSQAGAITIESDGRTVASSIANPRSLDAVTAYDYSDVRAYGDGSEVALFNTNMRPLIAQFPAPGPEGRWTARTTLGALGLSLKGADTAVRIDLQREKLSYQGQEFVLIEFEIPAFTYRLPGGEAVTHWARGVAVTDLDFAVIHVAATQHRATAISADGSVRPFAVRTTFHNIERSGRMKLRLDDLPQVSAAVHRLGETRAEPIMALSGEMVAEPFPRDVAARLDLASFSIGEGGGNPLPVVTGATTDAATTDTSASGSQNGTDIFRGQAAEVLRAQGMSDQDANRLLSALLEPDRSRELTERMDELDAYRRQIIHMSPDYEELQRPDADLTQPQVALRQVLRAYLNQENALLIEARLTTQRSREEEKWVESGKSIDDPEFQAAAAEKAALHEKFLNDRYDRMLQNLRLTNEQLSPGLDLGNELVPGWMSDPTSGDPHAAEDVALYRLLQEEMRRALDATDKSAQRELEERKQQREETVYDDTDDFFRNNAVTYLTLIGTVATDLSRWQDWLATQNVRELERLAQTAGYPNLASALSDSGNILRQSQDKGYRQWALQAPSCGGYVGCGPSYLERWHMKTSIVALGDILNASRDIFSTGGFNDIGISGLNLSYLLRDNALEDGDIVRVRISQFGRIIYEGQISLTNIGNLFNLGLGRGVASLEIYAVNEGSAPPNTAQISVDNVVRGQGTQSYSLRTGETATLRIEAGAKASGNGS